jgi:hypothetical protein
MIKIGLPSLAALLSSAVISERKLLAGLCALALLALALTNREVRKAIWAPARVAEGDTTAATAMLRSRLVAVYVLAAVILGGSAFDWLTDTEHWPFSQYPMFSWVDTQKSFTMLRLYGVTARQPLSEFPLDKNEYLEPFDNSRMPNALNLALHERRVTPALEDCLRRYEALRVSGVHNGPQLRALRLYRVTWTVDWRASNMNAPDHKELLGEVLDVGSKGQN